MRDLSEVRSALSNQDKKRSRLSKMMATGSLALKDLENEGEDSVTLFMRATLYEKDKNFEAAVL